MIYFKEEGHEYISDDNIDWISVTTLIKKYTHPYNKEFWSSYKALEEIHGKEGMGVFIRSYIAKKGSFNQDMGFIRFCLKQTDNAKKYNAEKKKVLKKWEQKGISKSHQGTLYHKSRELSDIKKGMVINPTTGNEVKVVSKPHHDGYDNSSYKSLKNLEDGLYPELLIFNKEYGILGQADRVFIENNEVIVRDYKTCDKIPFESYKKKTKMFFPLNNLEDCKGVKYQLQLSIYAYMLELEGYTIKNLIIDNFNKEIEVDYLREDVRKLFNDYKISKSL